MGKVSSVIITIIHLFRVGFFIIIAAIKKKKVVFKLFISNSDINTADGLLCWPSVLKFAKLPYLERIKSGVECVCIGLLW